MKTSVHLKKSFTFPIRDPVDPSFHGRAFVFVRMDKNSMWYVKMKSTVQVVLE